MKTPLIMIGIYLSVVIGLAVGWIMNIVTIVGLVSQDLGVEIIVRLVGVFALPLGGILGYINF